MNLKTVKLKLFNVSDNPSPQKVLSAGDYILLKHLHRNLFELDPNGLIIPDLAHNYSCNSGFTEFSIQIKTDQCFSDGSLITAQHFMQSIKAILKQQTAIHFDFNFIDSILATDDKHIQIRLKKSLPQFIQNLAHPEFGILKYENNYPPSLSVTSGHYSIKEINQSQALLIKNEYNKQFPFKPDQVLFSNDNTQDFDIQFFDSKNEPSNHQNLMDIGIGFTYWLTLNTDKIIFSNIENRKAISHYFSKQLKIDNTFLVQRTHGLFSRKSFSPAELITDNHIINQSVQVLLPKNHFLNSQIVELLKTHFQSVNDEHYESMTDFKNKKKQADIYMINNDFSDFDQSTSLNVSFNPNHFLINTNTEINQLIILMNSLETNNPKLQNVFSDIEKCILNNYLIIPLYTRKMPILVSSHLDISDWSNKYPEISAWKIKLKK